MELAKSIFSVILPLITAFVGWAVAKLKTGMEKDKAVEQGLKMLLRAKIIDLGLHYIEAGSIPPYGLETIKGCYVAYEALGNGDRSVVDIVNRCEKLPIRNG